MPETATLGCVAGVAASPEPRSQSTGKEGFGQRTATDTATDPRASRLARVVDMLAWVVFFPPQGQGRERASEGKMRGSSDLTYNRHDPEAVCVNKYRSHGVDTLAVWLREDKKRETCSDMLREGRQTTAFRSSSVWTHVVRQVSK